MGLGVGIFLIAVGAILAFAVNATSGAVDVHTVGWILMGVGLVSVLLTLMFWQSWAGPGYWTRRRTTYVDDGPPAGATALERRLSDETASGPSRSITASAARSSSGGFSVARPPPNIPLSQRLSLREAKVSSTLPCASVSVLVPVVLRSFGPDHCAHRATLAR